MTEKHTEPPAPSTPWTFEDSDELYNISGWGNGYFGVNDQGHAVVYPDKRKDGPTIDLTEVIKEIKDQNISFPTVVRFQDILRSQVAGLNRTFRDVIEKAGYHGRYTGVYPIKVNKMREVVEEIVDAGSPFNYGLEAGSKPELLAALAMNNNLDSLTVLNGYKDDEYLRLALLGRKLGRKVIVVIEKLSELPDLLRLAKEMNIEPMIGFRAKLSTKGSGKWAGSSGERAKFGLTIPEILQAIQMLKEERQEHCLKLFHFHIGSQICDIRTIKEAITEGARVYSKLVKLGLSGLEFFDVGGGLGVDYDGSKSSSDSSTNYTMREYIEDVVYILKQICDLEEVEHPNIVSESGRTITAHHSCVIVNVFDHIETVNTSFSTTKAIGEHMFVSSMRDYWETLNEKNFQEVYNDALKVKEDAINAFKLGILSLEERAKIETLYGKISKRIHTLMKTAEFIPEELRELDNYLAEQYLCNFSIFQSAPDSWAIGQLLPVIPLHRLNEKPTVECTLADITCDSDGKINKFIGKEDTLTTLPLHTIDKGGEPYYVGVFLTGAYQDVMGDMHNLFGALNEVHIFCDDEDPTDFYIEEVIPGSTAKQALATVQYTPEAMGMTMKKNIDKQVQRGKITPKEGVRLMNLYEESLKGYTYLKPNNSTIPVPHFP